MRAFIFLAAAFALFVATPTAAQEVFPDATKVVCIDTSVGLAYQIEYQDMIDTWDVSGFGFAAWDPEMPLDGSAMVRSNGDIVISFNMPFDWASGGWGHPLGTNMVTFPGGNLGAGIISVVYQGAGDPPASFLADAWVAPCWSITAQAVDPAAANRVGF